MGVTGHRVDSGGHAGTGSRIDATRSARNAGFPRSARLLKPTEYKRVFRENREASDRYFRVLAGRGQTGTPRLGMAVSRKLDKRAAVRNRIRRVIRESFRSWRADRLKDGGHALDIVVLPRAAATTTCNERLFQSLERHWSKLMSIGREQAD